MSTENEQQENEITQSPAKPHSRIGIMAGKMKIPEGWGFKDDYKDYIEDVFDLKDE